VEYWNVEMRLINLKEEIERLDKQSEVGFLKNQEV